MLSPSWVATRLARAGEGKWCQKQPISSVYFFNPPCRASCHCSTDTQQTAGAASCNQRGTTKLVLSSTQHCYCSQQLSNARRCLKTCLFFFLFMSLGLIKLSYLVYPVSLAHQSCCSSGLSTWVPTVWGGSWSWLTNYGENGKLVFNAWTQPENISLFNWFSLPPTTLAVLFPLCFSFSLQQVVENAPEHKRGTAEGWTQGSAPLALSKKKKVIKREIQPSTPVS